MKLDVKISPEEIQNIVREHLLKTFSQVGDVKMEVKQELRGNQMHEHYETVFKGASCEVEL